MTAVFVCLVDLLTGSQLSAQNIRTPNNQPAAKTVKSTESTTTGVSTERKSNTWAEMKRRNENDAIADKPITENMIKTHVPAMGQFILRRRKIWETIKRDYDEKKEVTSVMRQYLKMNETVSRGTNWIVDDKGTYTRIRPLSERCKDLENQLGIGNDFAPK
ncbi:MAG TPA: hypothetical protein PKZ32_22065 [Candidatus Melainabacteria bacterium]|nr:hypothetical protein [Candidatus Melainabacteria bacterium]